MWLVAHRICIMPCVTFEGRRERVKRGRVARWQGIAADNSFSPPRSRFALSSLRGIHPIEGVEAHQNNMCNA